MNRPNEASLGLHGDDGHGLTRSNPRHPARLRSRLRRELRLGRRALASPPCELRRAEAANADQAPADSAYSHDFRRCHGCVLPVHLVSMSSNSEAFLENNGSMIGGVSGTSFATGGCPPSRWALRWTTFDDARVNAACQPKPRAKRAIGEGWRRGWDSNPRAAHATRRFRGAPVTTTSVPLRVREPARLR